MSTEEQNDFIKQVWNGVAWAIGAQIVAAGIALLVLWNATQNIEAKVASIREDMTEFRVELKDVAVKADRLWWEREQRNSPTYPTRTQ